MTMQPGIRDHGGGLDAAVARWGGTRAAWLDLSTGINPVPYPTGAVEADAWTALPDTAAAGALLAAARRFWNVPDAADILAAPGASALIARLPLVMRGTSVAIPGPTYSEHAAAFRACGWALDTGSGADAVQTDAQVIVQPNNPDGRLWTAADIAAPFAVIDESFCDVTPAQSLMALSTRPGTVILKSFGKFWGLAGARLGFAIGDPAIIAALREALGPWPVCGPAISLGTRALSDPAWAQAARDRLARDAERLDQMMRAAGAQAVGGTTLFRLYDTDDAAAWQARLARHRIWSRRFPYSDRWLRLGLPHPDGFARLEAALR